MSKHKAVPLQEIIRRMRAGEKLRSVPDSILNDEVEDPEEAIMVIGNDILDEDSAVAVSQAEVAGVLLCSPCEDHPDVWHYEITTPKKAKRPRTGANRQGDRRK